MDPGPLGATSNHTSELAHNRSYELALYRFVLMNKGLSMLSTLLTKVSRLYLSYDTNEINFF